MGQKVGGQRRQIFPAIPQGGRLYGNDGQAVEKILAEVFIPREQGVGCGNDAGIEGHFLVAAQGTHGPRGKGAQQGLLDLGRGVAHFIQHERAALGCEKGPLARLAGFGEGPLDVSEQGVHEQVFVERAAVNGNERTVAAGAGFMNGARNQFLAGAGFADDENVGIRRRGSRNMFAQFVHDGRFAYQPKGRGNIVGHEIAGFAFPERLLLIVP